MGRSMDSGTEVPKAPTPGGGEGADSSVLFALLLDNALPSVCPSLALLPPGHYEFGEQKAPVVCSMPP